MSRILSIDYGKKKTGLAKTDPLKIIVSPLETVMTIDLLAYLETYFKEEEVELVVIGEPFHTDGRPAQFHPEVMKFHKTFQKKFPQMPVVLHDETNTSMYAKVVLLQSGAKKKKRRDKSIVDRIAASLLLEDYLKEKGIF